MPWNPSQSSADAYTRVHPTPIPALERNAKTVLNVCLVKSYESIEDVKKAILANPGGKPKKEEKFGNWVKNTMKCSNEEWIKDLWTWHKTENKL